jgi:hypothetical protein
MANIICIQYMCSSARKSTIKHCISIGNHRTIHIHINNPWIAYTTGLKYILLLLKVLSDEMDFAENVLFCWSIKKKNASEIFSEFHPSPSCKSHASKV